MPTVLRIGPFRFFFYGNENGELATLKGVKERSQVIAVDIDIIIRFNTRVAIVPNSVYI